MISPVQHKTYYSIREVCQMTGLEPHVLRYWETEFPTLKPKKNRAGNRAYKQKDIDIIKDIKHLLYEEKFTITGAKKKLTFSIKHETGDEVVTLSPPFDPEVCEDKVSSIDSSLKHSLLEELQSILHTISR